MNECLSWVIRCIADQGHLGRLSAMPPKATELLHCREM